MSRSGPTGPEFEDVPLQYPPPEHVKPHLRDMIEYELSHTPWRTAGVLDAARSLESPDREVRMLAFRHVCEALTE